MKKLISILFLIAGCLLCLYTPVEKEILDTVMSTTVETFVKESPPPSSDQLYEKMQRYNEMIYQEHQTHFSSLANCEHPPFDLSDYGFDNEVFAILDIPALSLHMPVYLGASEENLSLGAAVLGETSLPIGGKNTNSVIAGHRGWRGADYFLHLPELNIGDNVDVTNPWQTLHYVVQETKIIDPSDTSSVLIRNNEDLITLLTCHPYASGGKYRFAVFCSRID